MMGWVTLPKNIRAFIPTDRPTICRRCGLQIIWGMTENNKAIPINRVEIDGNVEYVPHFIACKAANKIKES